MKEPKKGKPKKAKTKPAKPQQEEEKDNRFDFGGLPGRDLKKNLGCG